MAFGVLSSVSFFFFVRLFDGAEPRCSIEESLFSEIPLHNVASDLRRGGGGRVACSAIIVTLSAVLCREYDSIFWRIPKLISMF